MVCSLRLGTGGLDGVSGAILRRTEPLDIDPALARPFGQATPQLGRRFDPPLRDGRSLANPNRDAVATVDGREAELVGKVVPDEHRGPFRKGRLVKEVVDNAALRRMRGEYLGDRLAELQ